MRDDIREPTAYYDPGFSLVLVEEKPANEPLMREMAKQVAWMERQDQRRRDRMECFRLEMKEAQIRRRAFRAGWASDAVWEALGGSGC